jgi:DNA-binding HxlR family transcriptional regulator
MRFSRLMERVEGFQPEVVDKVLRQLERDGLVIRAVFAEVPPRVEYETTELALEMLELVHPLWKWAQQTSPSFKPLTSRGVRQQPSTIDHNAWWF